MRGSTIYVVVASRYVLQVSELTSKGILPHFLARKGTQAFLATRPPTNTLPKALAHERDIWISQYRIPRPSGYRDAVGEIPNGRLNGTEKAEARGVGGLPHKTHGRRAYAAGARHGSRTADWRPAPFWGDDAVEPGVSAGYKDMLLRESL
ncbi:hypothetical protein OPT61_g6187 [Boeremia exigua]|uniref:Uncharacterized protein n=1 Tax=Boeremia exigua TaxID=749465 RepID=A0ACC2I7N4_9PLEO|nr:hypothetical protein OPT61_g6187 [Boeremia exigua]